MFDSYLKYHRIPEPELMEDEIQVQAYSGFDFREIHKELVESGYVRLPEQFHPKRILDLGVGSGEVSLLWADRFPDSEFSLLDGSLTMLQRNQKAWMERGLSEFTLYPITLQEFFPEIAFELIVSNSLFHHLGDPYDFWSCLQRSSSAGTFVVITDLLRPETLSRAKLLVEKYAPKAPEQLCQDFFNSLCAGYTLSELHSMLRVLRLQDRLRLEQITDRHWILFGFLA